MKKFGSFTVRLTKTVTVASDGTSCQVDIRFKPFGAGSLIYLEGISFSTLLQSGGSGKSKEDVTSITSGNFSNVENRVPGTLTAVAGNVLATGIQAARAYFHGIDQKAFGPVLVTNLDLVELTLRVERDVFVNDILIADATIYYSYEEAATSYDLEAKAKDISSGT